MPVIDLGSVVGPQGPQGAAGATGAQGIQGNPGPNQVTDQTSTNLNGVLFGNQSRVTVKPVDATPTADSGNLVSSSGVYDAVQTRLPKYGMGKNLLDNAYFLRPVNQRGQSSYSGAVYGIDRWRHNNGSSSVTLSSDGLTLTASIQYASFVQKLSTAIPAGTQCTVSVLYGSGSIQANTFAWPSSGNYYIAQIGTTGFYLTTNSTTILAITRSSNGSASITLKAIKLELGAEQTLAHQESGEWVLNEIPDYGEELWKCQRYLQPAMFGGYDGGGLQNCMARWVSSASQFQVIVGLRLSPQMHSAPTSLVNTLSTSARVVLFHTKNGAVAATPAVTSFGLNSGASPISAYIYAVTGSAQSAVDNGVYQYEVDAVGASGGLFLSAEEQ